jgi:hypothetical protein
MWKKGRGLNSFQMHCTYPSIIYRYCTYPSIIYRYCTYHNIIYRYCTYHNIIYRYCRYPFLHNKPLLMNQVYWCHDLWACLIQICWAGVKLCHRGNAPWITDGSSFLQQVYWRRPEELTDTELVKARISPTVLLYLVSVFMCGLVLLLI